MIFVGSNLDAALNILNAQTRKRTVGTGSPLIIHYHPSFSTVKYNLSQVTVTKVRSVLVNARGPTIRIERKYLRKSLFLKILQILPEHGSEVPSSPGINFT